MRKAVVPKIVLNAVEGWGKTSFFAYSENPLLLMARGETGYDTLLSAGRVPAIAAELVESWEDLIAWLDSLSVNPQGIKNLGLDAMGGFERLNYEFICNRHFDNDWGERGFEGFKRGYDMAVVEWCKMLQRLEQINTQHGVGITILGHSRIKTFNNPMGANFDRYIADCHEKSWGVTSRWADAVIFGMFQPVVDKEKQGKGKGVGGDSRIAYTRRRDAYDAKNRYGMPPEIELIDVGPEGMWKAITGLMVEEKTNAA